MLLFAIESLDAHYVEEGEYRALVEWYWQEKTEVLEEMPAPVQLWPPQIQNGLAWDLTQASMVKGQQLTAWAVEH